MNLNSEFLAIISYPLVKLACGLIFSFLVTFFGIPSIVKISNIKGLYDMPGSRTSHDIPTPRLGGAMIFAGVILSSALLVGNESVIQFDSVIGGLIVLFFIGVKDDIISLVPLKKAAGQLIASLILVIIGNIRLTLCDTWFASESVAYIGDILISLLLIMTLINSINLIDGIDGLASGIGIIGSLSFGIWFIVAGHISYAVLCLSLTGSLLAFFWYNVFSKKNKIFLGDTGSMIIGFLLAFFVISFLELNSDETQPNYLTAAPVIALSILFVPIYDTIRICVVRISQRKSIFNGDINHIHHTVLKISGSHIKAATWILSINILLIILIVLLSKLGNLLLLLLLVFVSACISFSLYFYLKRHPILKTNNHN
jgi:UDP-N-acetylmuramyl pentapeptide phosphotransferase/UDP-N-acetylglucosamine-1-phosphate transferase